jgi:hypothetical protein
MNLYYKIDAPFCKKVLKSLSQHFLLFILQEHTIYASIYRFKSLFYQYFARSEVWMLYLYT